MPIFLTASTNSSLFLAKAYGEVFIPRVSAARVLIPLRFIVKFTARAVGITLNPRDSNSTSLLVAIASTSGIMYAGFSSTIIFSRASASSIDITCDLSAICMAGEFAYLSTAITSSPRRFNSIATSRPSSPLPSSIAFVEFFLNTVPMFVIIFIWLKLEVVGKIQFSFRNILAFEGF